MPQTHYEVLGIAPDADARAVKAAYFAKVRQTPPETHPVEFQALREAYEVLSDVDRRAAYDEARGATYAALGHEAEALMRAGVAAMQAEAFSAAAQSFEAVVGLRPEFDEAWERWVSCLLSSNALDLAQARAEDFVRARPQSHVARYLLGCAQALAGKDDEAHASFVRASKGAGADLRPVRAAVALDVKQARFAQALAFLDERLADGGLMRRSEYVLRCERVDVLHRAGSAALADDELKRLEALVQAEREQPDEAKLGLVRFLEHQTAFVLARHDVARAETLLARHARLAPNRERPTLKARVVPLSALPVTARAWLEKQKSVADFGSQRDSGEGLLLGIGSVALGIVLLLAVALFAADDQGRPRPATWVLGAGLVSGLSAVFGGVWYSRSFLRAQITGLVTLHPEFLISVDHDVVRFLPLLSLTKPAVHHGVGASSSLRVEFASSRKTINLRDVAMTGADEAVEQFRLRLLGLLDSGLWEARPRVVEVLPADDVAPHTRARVPAWLVALFFFTASSSVAWLLHQLDTPVDRDFAFAMAAKEPDPLRRFVRARDGSDRRVFMARGELQARRAAVVAELSPRWPALARSLERDSHDVALDVLVRVTNSGAATNAQLQLLVTYLQRALEHRFPGGWFRLHLIDANHGTGDPTVLTLALDAQTASLDLGGADGGTPLELASPLGDEAWRAFIERVIRAVGLAPPA